MKTQTLEQLLKRRSTFIASKTFAESRLNAIGEDEHRDKHQFKKQIDDCQNEIEILDQCISWVKNINPLKVF